MDDHDDKPKKIARPPTADPADTLRRRYRQLEANHRDWQDQAQKDLRRQKLELDMLRRDNDHFKQQVNELRVAEATSSAGGSLRNPQSTRSRKTKELDAKRDTISHLETRIATEQQNLSNLQRELKEVQAKVRSSRKNMGGVNVTKDSHEVIDRQVSVLENRLDQSLVRFNEVLRQNKDLREQIDTLRGERDVFEAIYQKLEGELQEKKKEMAFIIEVSNIAYEERDNNVQVLNNLKTFAAEEMSSFSETFKELDDLLEEDRRMKEQVKLRIQTLEKKLGNARAEEKKRSAASRNAAPTAAATQEVNAGRDAQMTTAHSYEEAFNRIRQATDIPDLNELVERFLRAEEENYSLFSFVNDLGKEIESLEKQRTELLDEIESISTGNEEDQQRRATLKVLEDRLRAEEHKNQQFIDLSQKIDGTLRSVMEVVESLFTRLDCDETIIVEQHGVSGLSMENLLLHLASIEMRADEYIASWGRQTGALPEIANSRGPAAPFETTAVSIDVKRLPGTGEEAGEGSDDDDHPLSREELLRKVHKKLNAQSVAAAERRTIRGNKGRVAMAAGKK